jgi:hypothetical protein
VQARTVRIFAEARQQAAPVVFSETFIIRHSEPYDWMPRVYRKCAGTTGGPCLLSLEPLCKINTWSADPG